MAQFAIDRMRRPEAVFLRCDDERIFTYQMFWNLCGQLAGALSSIGARPGDRIAVQIDKSIEAIAMFWACVRGGFVFLPLNTAYTSHEVAYFLSDAEPAVFLCTPAKYDALLPVALAAGCAAVLTLNANGRGTLADLMAKAGGQFSDHAGQWSDLVAILYTSGTTGRSKGAMLSQANLTSNAAALVDAWQFTEGDKLIHALPVYHTHGLFTATNTVFFSGGELLYRRSFDVSDVVSLFSSATAMMGVPTFYSRLLQHPGLTREAVRHMHVFISGSAPLLIDTSHSFEALTGHAILERYGMTETSMNTSNPYVGLRRPGTVGLPLPGVQVRITDRKTGETLSAGQDGMIEIKGPNVFSGYWRNPEKTKEAFTGDGFFLTGDVGHFDENGYLVISGRAKDLIITGGFNVYPREVELLIDAMPGVAESAVIGVPHPDFGEGVVAIVATDGVQELSENGVVAELKLNLAAFKVPKRVIFVPSLPRNAMGKVQKAVLREDHKELLQ
jgi:malonyl-CoA/methylmalonyl-CoA synthetase